MSLVMDLRVSHNRVDSSDDPSLNGHLRYPNNLDQSLNHRYRTDYNNNPTRGVDLMPSTIAGMRSTPLVGLLLLVQGCRPHTLNNRGHEV